MKYLNLFICSMMFFACNQPITEKAEAQEPIDSEEISSDLPADFPAFYQQFHADSNFQKEHIQWPLRAIPNRPLEEGEKFYYTPETWKVQQLISPVSGYQSDFTVLGEDMVVEKIVNPKDRTMLERRFFRNMDGIWQLIYYQGVRKID